MVIKSHKLPVTQQCRLLEVSRSSAYYQPVAASTAELELSQVIDKIHLDKPFLGSRGIRDRLLDFKQVVNRHAGMLFGGGKPRCLNTQYCVSELISKPSVGHILGMTAGELSRW